MACLTTMTVVAFDILLIGWTRSACIVHPSVAVRQHRRGRFYAARNSHESTWNVEEPLLFKLLLRVPKFIYLEHSMDRMADPYWLPNGGRNGDCQ